MLKEVRKVIGGGVLVVFFVVGISVLMAYPLMWAWNYVMPDMFGLPMITFWKMFCLNFVISSFFKNTNYNSK